MKNKLRKMAIFATTLAMIAAPKSIYANIIHHSAHALHFPNVFQGIFIDPDNDEPFNMYKQVFGENHETIQRNSRAVNRTTYYDGIRMNVLSTGVITNVFRQQAYVFFTLQDETGSRLGDNIWLDIEHDWSIVSKHATQLHFDEETNTATFVLNVWYFDNESFNDDYRNITININGIHTNRHWGIDTINQTIEIGNLLKSHNPTFVTDVEEEVLKWWTRELELTGWTRGGDKGLHYILDNQILARDELNIRIGGVEGAYISNIALVDNTLHVQTRGKVSIEDSSLNQWVNVSLLNEEGSGVSTEYGFTISGFDENLNRIEGIQYTQRGFYIEDLEEISSYTLELHIGSFDDASINLEISLISPVISNGITLEESKVVLLDGEELSIDNILISPMFLSFNLDAQVEGFNEFMNLFVNIINNLQVEFFFDDGTQEEVAISWETTNFLNVFDEESESNMYQVYIANKFDIDRLVAININGTHIEI